MRINPMNLDKYPDEVTYEILSRAPVESAFECKSVCKSWRNFFDYIKEGMLFAIGLNNEENPNFRLYYAENDMIRRNIKERRTYADLLEKFHHPPMENRYHENPYENYKDVIVGSCNGLVCFTIPNNVVDDPVYICNPFTRESVNLPRLAASFSSKGLVVSGFGFDSHNEQYKVVRIYYPDKNIDVGHVEVYTLGSGSGWRNIGEVTYSLCSSPGILVEGVLHWIDYKAMKIVGFSLKDENFELLPSPPCLHLGKAANYRLRKLRGCLCVVHHKRLCNRVDIWFYTRNYSTSCSYNMNMESSYDRYWSWEIKLKPITYFEDDDYDPLLVTEKNKVIYWCNKSNLYCFDPETSTTMLVIQDTSDLGLKYFSATPHLNTRVSLKNLEKENCVAKEWDGRKGELYQPKLSIDPQLIRRAHANLAVPYWEEAARRSFTWFLIIYLCICFVYAAGWLVFGVYPIGDDEELVSFIAEFVRRAEFYMAFEMAAYFILEQNL